MHTMGSINFFAFASGLGNRFTDAVRSQLNQLHSVSWLTGLSVELMERAVSVRHFQPKLLDEQRVRVSRFSISALLLAGIIELDAYGCDSWVWVCDYSKQKSRLHPCTGATSHIRFHLRLRLHTVLRSRESRGGEMEEMGEKVREVIISGGKARLEGYGAGARS